MKKIQSKIFNTPTGQINARVDGGVVRATGIPYAKAKRYREPVAVDRYATVVEATQKSPACPQTKDSPTAIMFGVDLQASLVESENCLNLSVTRPANNHEDLPVMVWIHGGSYVSGAGDVPIFNPQALVTEQNVIVVNVTYRLGVFGFLGGYNDVPANLGFLDMIEALRWVNKNIGSMGGNPDNVTLFGQSAGGDAVAQMIIADGTEGLFRNVIIQSSPFGLIFGKERMINEMIAVVEKIPAGISTEEILEKQPEVLKISSEYGFKAGMALGVQYGKYPFPEETEVKAAWRRKAKNVNVLIGFAAEETSFFIPFVPLFKKIVKIPVIGGLLKAITVNVTTKMVYGKGGREFARNCALSGGNVYQYKISWGSKTNGIGAAHTIDLPLLFGGISIWENAKLVEGVSLAEMDEKGRKFRALWARFARTGQLEEKGGIEGVLKYKKLGNAKYVLK